jgi:[NiFe] hydrogenase diaphorase moiety large subunit
MSTTLDKAIKGICQDCDNDRNRMMDIVCAVQAEFGCVSSEAMDLIAQALSTKRVEVESVVSFYAFLSKEPKGKVVIRLCDDIIDEMKGSKRVAEALKDELGIDFGETTPDGKISLEYTPCIGMCDQAPAGMVDDVIVNNLSGDIVREGIQKLREHMNPKKMVRKFGDGNNGNDLVRAAVRNNLRLRGDVIFGEMEPGKGLKRALALNPAEVIRQIKTSRLRGRGGAGFPCGMKWEFTRAADGEQKYLICNSDEGEPGTFKDRVILTEAPHLMIEGMVIGGYAIGATKGIIYLRAEYTYLKSWLESTLEEMRQKNLLGDNILGQGVNFDITIQMGAGAYICGEETALISSCEGLRGDPKNRPPFPAQKGYKQCPTSVNNVETLCSVARILEKGPGWFAQMGSAGSSGTKLLSISGDCMRPGVYEIQFGVSIAEVLKLCGADEVQGVQIGGPSGQMLGPDSFERTICYDDVATGGSFMVFNQERDLLEVARKFMEFFVEESCGYCTPCRVGNVLLKKGLDKILAGKGEAEDLEYLQTLGQNVKLASRCGLGQTSANPVLSTLENFRPVYEAKLMEAKDGQQPSFDIKAALSDSESITGRESVHFKG